MMKKSVSFLILLIALSAAIIPTFGKGVVGDVGGSATEWNRMGYNGALKQVQGMAPEDQGGKAKTQNQEQPLEDTDLAKASGGKSTVGDAQTGLPASAIKLKWPAGAQEAMKRNMANTDGRLPTNSEMQLYLANFANTLAAGANAPDKQMHSAKANLDAQGTEVANSMADLEKQQAASAIDFCSSFLTNFTAEGGNKWNKLRDNIFLPMAVLLLLPGAVLTQVKSIIAAGTPVLGEANPFEGIQRALIAIFLIPGTYLVLNYSIDLNNSITYSIAEEYTRLFGSNMYKDAISFHIRAFPSRQPAENRNALDQQTAKMTPLLGGKTAFARFEGKMIENKIEDPVAGIYQAPIDRADEALASSSIMAKTMFNSTNATFMIAWNILCAFQMVYFYYLWFVGPITAALWAWPMKSLRNAFPSWCEGVITLGFWSLFWNTSILLMACFRGVDETGTLILTALNFLATSSVKYAFDFAGLAKAAGQEAASMAEKAMNAAKGGGGGGGGGKGGHAGAGHKGGKHGAPHHTGDHVKHAETPGGPKVAGGAPDNQKVASGSLSDSLVAANKAKDDQPIRVASNDPDAGFRELARREGAKTTPPPVDGDNGSVRTLPGDSFTVGDGGAGGNMFTRSMVDGKPVLTVSDMEGNAVKGMDGKDLGPISLSDIPEGGTTVQFDPDASGRARGSINIEQGTHGGQLYHASSHGHSELVSFSGGHFSGHSSAAVDTGMRASMMGGQPVAELQPGLFYGSDGNGNGALYDIDHNQINFDSNGNAQLDDGRLLSMQQQQDGSQLLSVGGDQYALSAMGSNLNVNHGDATHNAYSNPINSLSMGRDANTGAYTSSLYNDHHQRTESSATLGADTQRAYYNPDTQGIIGSSYTHQFPNGDSSTSFLRDDGSLVGTNMYQMTDNGFRETVLDANGAPVSVQDTAYDDSGYTVTSASFTDGSITGGDISSFNNAGVFQSSSPIDNHHMQSIAGDVSSLSQYANSISGVVPDKGVFGATVATSSAPAQQTEVANNYANPFTSSRVDVGAAQMFDPKAMAEQMQQNLTQFSQNQTPENNPTQWPKVEVAQGEVRAMPSNETPKVMPVDIAGTQLSRDFSQVDGAYAATNLGQGQTAEVAYSNPVTTASVDIMPPQLLDSTPMAYQQAELNASKMSLESQMSSQVGDLTNSFNFNATQGPPVGEFTKRDSAPDTNQFVVGAPQVGIAAPQIPVPGADQKVLPVDIAGTSMTENQVAMELAQKAQIEGSYAANLSSQGNTAEVAYSSPVTTASVDVLPPQVLDSTPMAYQQAELNAPKTSLESQMSNQVGDLNNSFNFNATQGPPVGEFTKRDVAPDANQYVYGAPQLASSTSSDGQAVGVTPNFAQSPDRQTVVSAPQFAQSPDQKVLPVDIAGSAITDNKAAMELSQNAQIEGAYAANLASQGNTAEVAYSSPITTSSVDVLPPQVLDSTPMAYQQAELNAPKTSLESQMSNQVGDLNNSFNYNNTQGPPVGEFVKKDAAPPDQTFVSYDTDHAVSYDNDHTVVNNAGMVASPQVTHGPAETQAVIPQYGQTRTESAAQIASAAALASSAQQHLIGDPKIESRGNQVPPGGLPKRGLGTIFSDITMGKKAVKPSTNAANAKPKVDPASAQAAGLVVQPTDAKTKPVEPGALMGKMRDSVDGETTMQLSTNQSLEKQMLEAGAHVQPVPASTLGSVLGKTSAAIPQKPSEYLTNALVDYHTVAALIHEGKTNEAALVSGNALANISRCTGSEPQLLPLVRAFVELFKQKNMIHQAKAFAEKESALNDLAKAATAAGSKDNNIWGS